MAGIDLSERYDRAAIRTIRRLFPRDNKTYGIVLAQRYQADVLRADVSADSLHEGMLHAEMHLGGIFAVMLEKDQLNINNVTVEDVRNLAERITISGKPYNYLDGEIHDGNYKKVLCHLSILTSMGLAADERSPLIGLVDIQNEPVDMFPTVFEPEPPAEVPVPKRPNLFKRIMNRMFNLFSADFEKFENDKAAREQYENDLVTHEANVEAANERYEKNALESRKLQEALNNTASSKMVKTADADLDVAMDFNTFNNSKSAGVNRTAKKTEPSMSAEKPIEL
ncbi:MAG: hypothetical protein E7485_04765 [Ruminococcaceae bacterium]|nr:hypothetical protein [Oscillospiraceae bacterium]